MQRSRWLLPAVPRCWAACTQQVRQEEAMAACLSASGSANPRVHAMHAHAIRMHALACTHACLHPCCAHCTVRASFRAPGGERRRPAAIAWPASRRPPPRVCRRWGVCCLTQHGASQPTGPQAQRNTLLVWPAVSLQQLHACTPGGLSSRSSCASIKLRRSTAAATRSGHEDRGFDGQERRGDRGHMAEGAGSVGKR